MPILLLEDFSEQERIEFTNPVTSVPALNDNSESEKLGAYEDGYTAGWDDAIQSHQQDVSQFNADFARALQEISLTYNDVRMHVTAAIEEFVLQLVETTLPALSPEMIAQSFREVLYRSLQDVSDQPISLVVAPGYADRIAEIVQDCAPTAVTVQEEPSLSPRQAFLRTGEINKIIDVAGVLDTVSEAL